MLEDKGHVPRLLPWQKGGEHGRQASGGSLGDRARAGLGHEAVRHLHVLRDLRGEATHRHVHPLPRARIAGGTLRVERRREALVLAADGHHLRLAGGEAA